MRAAAAALLCLAALPALAQQPRGDAAGDATTLAPVRVTAPRPRIDDLYRSRPPERTAPTVFDRAWREPLNLKKIGDEGGVIPILVRYAQQQVTKGARKLPGWKPPVQAAIARPPPLDQAQLQRALRLQEGAAGAD